MDIPLDKNLGLRPISVGEVLRRIAGKMVVKVMKRDVQEVVGSFQMCAGHPGGCEAVIDGIREILEDLETDVVLLIDATHASNAIIRQAMLAKCDQ